MARRGQSEDEQRRARWMRTTVSKLREPLLRYCARLLGATEEAHDVVQDAFLKLWTSARVGVGDEEVRRWLHVVCRNRCIDLQRRGARRRTLAAYVPAAASPPGPAEQVAARRTLERFGALFAALDLDQQEVLHLKLDGGLSYREISEITGHSVANVGNLLHRTLQLLRRELGEPTHIRRVS